MLSTLADTLILGLKPVSLARSGVERKTRLFAWPCRYAEYVAAPQGLVMPLPDHFDYVQGAAVPEARCHLLL